jgi:hypothetical protein
MKLVEINWNPTDRQLRQFGWICVIALPLVGWIWGADLPVLLVIGGIGLALSMVGLALPGVLKPIFLALTIVATPIGLILGEVAMLLVYFGVFLPIGLAFRLAKRDALQLKRDSTATSYWQLKKQTRSVASYYRQF